MVSPINGLANMEYALYGGSSLGSNAPNALNGYMANSGMYNNYYNPYYSNGNYYANNAYPDVYQGQSQAAQPQTQPTQQDLDTLAKYYAKGQAPSEGIVGAALGGAAFGLIQNPRLIAHPWNSISTTKTVENMFSGIKKEGTALNKLWTGKETNGVMREAYFQMHKLESRAKSKLGWIRKRYTDTEYKALKQVMEKALKTGDVNKIAEASATLQHSYVNNGAIPRGWNKVVNKFRSTPKEVSTVAERMKDTAGIAAKTTECLKGSKASLTKLIKKGCSGKGALFFMGIELLMGLGKIKEAFSKDSSTGMKQLGQTTVKGLGSAIGWGVGEAVGTWGAAAIGAKLGTLISPGVGTAIGGVLGLIGGSIGCWLTGKATNAIFGQDVADKVTAEKMTKTQEGQVQLLTYAAQKAQEGKLPQDVQKSAERLMSVYA